MNTKAGGSESTLTKNLMNANNVAAQGTKKAAPKKKKK